MKCDAGDCADKLLAVADTSAVRKFLFHAWSAYRNNGKAALRKRVTFQKMWLEENVIGIVVLPKVREELLRQASSEEWKEYDVEDVEEFFKDRDRVVVIEEAELARSYDVLDRYPCVEYTLNDLEEELSKKGKRDDVEVLRQYFAYVVTVVRRIRSLGLCGIRLTLLTEDNHFLKNRRNLIYSCASEIIGDIKAVDVDNSIIFQYGAVTDLDDLDKLLSYYRELFREAGAEFFLQ